MRGWRRGLAVAFVVAEIVAGGGVASAAPDQGPSAGGPVPAEPPADNVFPVPLPYEVGFDDTWHACRDGCSRRHKGNDLMADEGTPAVAVESGTIVEVDDVDDGNGGLSIWLLGDSGVAYYYAHNSQNLVAEGQRVARGQMVASVGRTGNARTTPPHIHFQINLCGETSSAEPCTVDPYAYLSQWARTEIGGGADGVAWYEPASGTVVTRTDVGSPLGSLTVGLPGATGVLPVAGDWDGDGRDSVGLYQRSNATFHLRDDEGRPLEPLAFGEPGRADVWPIAGDFDGDGRDTVGLYRSGDATFVALTVGGGASPPVALGTPGRTDALPVAADWDGDGRDGLGLYHRTDGSVLRLDDAGDPLPAADAAVTGPEVWPVAGDWDGDGRDTVGAVRPDGDAGSVFDLPVPTPDDPARRRTMPVDGSKGTAVLPVAGDWNGHDLVTLDELRQIYGTIPHEAEVVAGLPALNAAMAEAGVATPARKAAFLATVRSESGFRVDAVEAGSPDRYRGRGLIQLTGEHNYTRAGDDLGLDLVGDPDLATGALASPAIAAWYWTVARDINAAADRLDMAAVNYAVGYEPSVRRDMIRCSDFLAALRFYTGDDAVEGVNCERTPASLVLGLASGSPMHRGDGGSGRDVTAPAASPAPATSATTGPPSGAAPAAPPRTAPASPSTAPPTGPTTSPPATSSTTAPPTTAPSTTVAPTTQPPSDGTLAPPEDGLVGGVLDLLGLTDQPDAPAG